MSKTLTDKTPTCFRDFLKRYGAVARNATNLNSVISFVEGCKTATTEARQRFVVAPTLETFEVLLTAKQKFDAADSCIQEVTRCWSALGTSATDDPETARIIVACLREMKRAVESQVQECRNEWAGLAERILGRKSEGDHPEVANLRREIERFQDSLDRIENSSSAPTAVWQNNCGLILDWIRQHEPALLNEK